METLFSNKEWVGEFFLPDQFERRFFGKITFSPEKGVVLAYHIAGHEVPAESDILYGILETGEKCTLVGKFLPAHSGFSVKNGLSTRHGKNGFYFLVLGEFLNHEEKFSEISFSLTGMQEFFFPKGYKDLVKYSDKPLFSVETEYGEIEVGNNASFAMLGKDITSQIYNRNDEALSKLKSAFENINSKYENSFFMLKKDISYMIKIKTNNECSIGELYEHIIDISNLFAILIYGPVYPEMIKLRHVIDGEHPAISTIYPSLALETRTSEMCKMERSHFHMPITKSNINLPEVILKWLSQPKAYSAIVSSLQNETGFRNEHSLHGELVLYATQFESISYSYGVSNSHKYEYPVNEYATQKIKDKLISIFANAGESSFGKGIGNLRNEIAHVGRPRALLSALSIEKMVDISQLLQITIIGYILHTLGVERSVIEEYQNKFTP